MGHSTVVFENNTILIQNNTICPQCLKFFTEKERPRLVRIGDEKNYSDFHKKCIEPALQTGLLYYKEEV